MKFFFLGREKLFAGNKMIYQIYDLVLIIHRVLTLRIKEKAQPFALFVHHVPSARSGLARARMRNFQNK